MRLLVTVAAFSAVRCSAGGTAGLPPRRVQRVGDIPILVSATKGPGNSFGPGWRVEEGSRLLGDVFPAADILVDGVSVDDRGWLAVFAITGDVRRVLAGYARQAAAAGVAVGPVQCHRDQGLECRSSAPSGSRAMALDFTQAPARHGELPVRRLELTYVDPDSRRVLRTHEPFDDRALAALPTPAGRAPTLPARGERFEDSEDFPPLRVAGGSDLIAPAGAPSRCLLGGSTAVFQVTGDPRQVVAAYLAQLPRGYLKHRQWTAGSARVLETYTSSGHSYVFNVVLRPEHPTFMLIDHCPTD